MSVPIQSLIDHIKTAIDVDPWAKEMAEKLLKEKEPLRPIVNSSNRFVSDAFRCRGCGHYMRFGANYCEGCGRKVLWR